MNPLRGSRTTPQLRVGCPSLDTPALAASDRSQRATCAESLSGIGNLLEESQAHSCHSWILQLPFPHHVGRSEPWPKPGSWSVCHAVLLPTCRLSFLRKTARSSQPGPVVRAACLGSNRSRNPSWQWNTTGPLTQTSRRPLPVPTGWCEQRTALCWHIDRRQHDRSHVDYLRHALERTLLNPRVPRMELLAPCTDRRIGLPSALTSARRVGKPARPRCLCAGLREQAPGGRATAILGLAAHGLLCPCLSPCR